MAKDISDGVPVGYVNPLVIAPLERRDVVWKKFAAEHKWQQRFAVGKFSHAVADDNAKLATPALKTHPDVKAVFAAYGIDISDADIELMTKENSPWRATATTDPSAIGAGVTRAPDARAGGSARHEAGRVSGACWLPRTLSGGSRSRTWETCARSCPS
jgi:simple sugar transport system substrate-binding protein